VLVVAKNTFTHAALSKQFQEKTNLRIYKALVCGEVNEKEKTFRSYLYRDPRHRTSFASMDEKSYKELCEKQNRKSLPGYKFAESYFKRERVFCGSATLVSVKLSTGRTHQIRVHAKAQVHPVVGDQIYGGDLSMVTDSRVAVALQKVGRQMLHAETLGFTHPRTEKKMAFQADPPRDFSELIEFLDSMA
jgi:23S rRNA pseudouridine1911/1915/1917 synthase